MFVTNDDALYDRVLTLSNHGRARGQTKHFWPDMVGFKYKISNIQAAIGCAQMERFDELAAGKRRVFQYYAERFKDLPVKMNLEPPGTVNGFWMPTIVVNEGVLFDREVVLAAFRRNNIDARSFFWPLSMLPMFKPRSANTVSYALHARALNLPSYHDIQDADLAKICNLVSQVLGGNNGSHN